MSVCLVPIETMGSNKNIVKEVSYDTYGKLLTDSNDKLHRLTHSISGDMERGKAYLNNHEIWNYESGIGKDGISNGASTMMDLNNNCVGQSLSGSPYSCESACLRAVLSNSSGIHTIH